MSELTGVLTLTLDRREHRRRLPRVLPVTLGRDQSNGLEIREPWVSNELVTFDPRDDGWSATFGPRSRVTLSGLWVDGEARYRPKATVLVTEGTWVLEWRELDRPCRIDLEVRPVRPGDELPAFLIGSEPRRQFGLSEIGREIALSAVVRHRLAVVFRHVINEEPAPANLYRAAADELDIAESDVKNLVNRTRQRVNRYRGQELQDADDLGSYLVRAAELIDEHDFVDPG